MWPLLEIEGIRTREESGIVRFILSSLYRPRLPDILSISDDGTSKGLLISSTRLEASLSFDSVNISSVGVRSEMSTEIVVVGATF